SVIGSGFAASLGSSCPSIDGRSRQGRLANAVPAPDLGRARGGPVSFLPLATRGVTRREGAWPGFRPTRPVFTGAPRTPGPWRTCRVRPRPLDAPRGITAFAFTASRTEPAVFVPRGGFPSAARGRGLRLPRSRVPHPAPPSRRLMRAPLDGRDLYHL